MKNKYIAPNITVVDLEIESQILAASQVPVVFDNSEEDYIGDFKSSNHIFVFDDEELEQD
ncbi:MULTISPECIES: hypothetical protein [Prevotella]|mgnify:FL=1|jgi:hypothetical protein|uniref:hypothetical protein n=1 Tax=Prevotella TaxID=838 RepID=UPI000D0FD741|nr:MULTISPECIES: hypothetical protein [Prevotella]